MISDSSKMLRMIRACTARSAAEFGTPLSRQRAAVEKAENGKVSAQTIDELVAKALETYSGEIPPFLVEQAQLHLAASRKAAADGSPHKADPKRFRLVEIRKLDDLEQIVSTGHIATDCPSDRAFAISVRDTAMQPEIREGAVAVLNPDVRPTEGTLVGALLTSSGTVIRRYSRVMGDRRRKTLLTSPNPNAYPSLSCLRNELRWIYVVHSITSHF